MMALMLQKVDQIQSSKELEKELKTSMVDWKYLGHLMALQWKSKNLVSENYDSRKLLK